MKQVAALVLVCLGLSMALDSVESRWNKSAEQVIGGGDASITNYPFMALVSVRRGAYPFGHYFCGGTIVSRRYIMTAAHCIVESVRDRPVKFVPVMRIAIGIGCQTHDKCLFILPVRKIIAYKPFGPNIKNDIALLKLNSEINFEQINRDRHVITAVRFRMSVQECPEEEKSFKWSLVGWGQRGSGESQGKNLQIVALPNVEFNVCRRAHKGLNEASVLCAGDRKHSGGSGDSGAPLLAWRDSGQLEQIGVLSRQLAGRPQNEGIVFTRVAHYSRWIWSCITEHPLCGTSAHIHEAKDVDPILVIPPDPTPMPPPPADDQPEESKAKNEIASIGDRTSEYEEQIIGGEEAKPGEFPFMAHLIIYSSYEKSDYFCGGTIVDARHILTLATCVTTNKTTSSVVPLSFIKVGIGCHQLDRCDYSAFSVVRIMMHRSYAADKPYDLALLKLSKEIKFNQDPAKRLVVAPVMLATSPACRSVRTMDVAGWGITSKPQPSNRLSRGSNTLQKTRVNIVNDNDCRKRYPWMDPVGHKCFGSASKGTCRYDIGGPLLQRIGPAHYLQVGIIAESVCTDSNGGIFQMIPQQYKWIWQCLSNDYDRSRCPHVAQTSVHLAREL